MQEQPKQYDKDIQLLEDTIQDLSTALEIIRLHRMFGYQRKDWGFEAASEREWKAWVMRQQ